MPALAATMPASSTADVHSPETGWDPEHDYLTDDADDVGPLLDPDEEQ
jgi:hypothetical protein